MSVIEMVAIMPAPSSTFEAPSEKAWLAVESQLGIALPDDYKEFVHKYGTGSVDNFLWVFNPTSRNENVNFLDQISAQLKVLIELQSYGEIIPYRLFPAQGGILPFAITDNGDVLFWLSVGEPNSWTVLVNEARSPEWEVFDMSMSKFLLGILSRRLICGHFPKSFPRANPVFYASH
ncbi:MAG: SMI1/KNR4 family protein [Pseudomonas sp.]|uniref:SMI1/KNR4 family protein n=1 Tax=Pseudomonas sp. TaxID=306 RepID=UPI0033970244